jgi:hypothetical protein
VNATLDKLMSVVVRRVGPSLLASPDAAAEAQEDGLHDDPAAEEYVAWLSARGLSLARPASKKRLLKELLEECERREEELGRQLATAREIAVRGGGSGPASRAVARYEAELADLETISSRIFPLVRPALIRGAERPETVRCRYFHSCRGWLTPRDAWQFASVCETCREAAAERRAGNEEGTWLDELVAF